ncbi:TonB-dependent receptor plug domain-containing protein, partial [Acidobacteriota bacterium]
MAKIVLVGLMFCLTLILAPTVPAAAEDQDNGIEAEGQDREDAREEKDSPPEKPQHEEIIVVTPSRVEQDITESPVSVTVIRPEHMETSPADSYADLMRGVPGLNVVQMSARDMNFSSRGSTGTLATSQLALLDGRSIYQDFFGFVMWDFLPMSLEEVDRIEILRGPGSAVWGANALSGVVNVRAKTPRQLDGGLFSLGYGERDTFSAYFRWADAMEKVSYKLSASYYTQDPWDRQDTLPNGDPLPPTAVYENEGTEQPK